MQAAAGIAPGPDAAPGSAGQATTQAGIDERQNGVWDQVPNRQARRDSMPDLRGRDIEHQAIQDVCRLP